MSWGVVWQIEASIAGEANFVITTRDPSATLTEYLSEPDRYVSIMSNLNDHIELELDDMTLVGRTDPNRGPAQSIIVPETKRDTLHLRNKQLTLDISGTRANFDDYAATTNAIIAQMQATIAQQAAAIAVLSKQAAGALLGIDTYNSSQVITIPPNARRAFVKMWGGTAGTNGVDASIGGVNGATGAAGYLEKLLVGLIPGNTLTFTFGARGIGGNVATNVSGSLSNPITPGTPGGNSVLASGTQIIDTLTAGGSPVPVTTTAAWIGGLGGTASGGDLNITGQPASDGYAYTAYDVNSQPYLQLSSWSTPGVTMYSSGALHGYVLNPNYPGRPPDFQPHPPYGFANSGTDGGLIIEWYSGGDSPVTFTFAGVGSLTVNAFTQKIHQQLLAAGFFGSTNLMADATRRVGPGTTLLGSGSLVADAIRRIRPGTTIQGSGGVACDAAYKWTLAGGLTPF